MFIGIDGCKAGWLIATIKDNNITFEIIKNINDYKIKSDNRLTLIDMPIGLHENMERVCDLEARKILKPKRHSSVFMTPIRNAVYADSYKNSCKINYNSLGKKISIQAWNITPKIREIDDFRIKFPQYNIRESHPEVCFWAFNKYKACEYPKKKKLGEDERLMILERIISGISKEIFFFENNTLRKDVVLDDIIDATVLACTAKNYSNLKILGDNSIDSKGLPMEIIYSD